MPRMLKLSVGILAASAALVVTHSPLAAQTCVGMPSFANGMVQVAGGGAFTEGANLYSGTLGLGAPAGPFAKVGLGRTSYDDLDGSSLDVGGQVGYQLAVGRSAKAELCPIAGFSLGFGPDDILGTGVDASTHGFDLGLALGTSLRGGSGLEVVPNAGLAFAYSRVKLEDATGSATSSESYALARFGLGLVFNSTVGVSPSVSVPVGLDGSDPTFGLTLSVNFGGRR
jgi:hypothetical protein